jgi:hypothetical protein
MQKLNLKCCITCQFLPSALRPAPASPRLRADHTSDMQDSANSETPLCCTWGKRLWDVPRRGIKSQSFPVELASLSSLSHYPQNEVTNLGQVHEGSRQRRANGRRIRRRHTLQPHQRYRRQSPRPLLNAYPESRCIAPCHYQHLQSQFQERRHPAVQSQKDCQVAGMAPGVPR